MKFLQWDILGSVSEALCTQCFLCVCRKNIHMSLKQDSNLQPPACS